MSIIKKYVKQNIQIVFFGSNHNRNPFQLDIIRREIDSLSPDIVLVEGGFEIPVFENEAEAIDKGLETGFVSYLSKKKNINIEGNDPPEKECIKIIEKLYGRDFAFLYFVLRGFNPKSKYSAKEMINRNIEKFKRNSSWDYDFSFENFLNVFKSVFQKNFSEDTDYSDYFNPHLRKSMLNFASYQLNIFRDNFTTEKIFDSIQKYKKIFVIKGEDHLLNCQGRLDDFFYGRNV